MLRISISLEPSKRIESMFSAAGRRNVNLVQQRFSFVAISLLVIGQASIAAVGIRSGITVKHSADDFIVFECVKSMQAMDVVGGKLPPSSPFLLFNSQHDEHVLFSVVYRLASFTSFPAPLIIHCVHQQRGFTQVPWNAFTLARNSPFFSFSETPIFL